MIISKELSEAAVEFKTILKNSSPEITRKIPKKLLTFLERIESKSYIFVYDKSKSLKDQDLKFETKGLIALIYRDYLCDEAEKNDYIMKYKKFINEKELKLKNNSNKLNTESKKNITNEKAIIKYNKQNIIQKIFDKIKKILKRKN